MTQPARAAKTPRGYDLPGGQPANSYPASSTAPRSWASPGTGSPEMRTVPAATSTSTPVTPVSLLPAASNPTLAPGGVFNLSALQNLVLVLDYSFTPRG